MNKIIIILLAGIFVISTQQINAQNESREARMEKFRTEKIAFLTTKLELTTTEAEKFWPIYNQLEKERWEARAHRLSNVLRWIPMKRLRLRNSSLTNCF